MTPLLAFSNLFCGRSLYKIRLSFGFREWEKEVYNGKLQGKNPSLFWAIAKAFGVGYSMLGLVVLTRVSWEPSYLGILQRSSI